MASPYASQQRHKRLTCSPRRRLQHLPCRSYISAVYVKWIESAGGRAVPIRFYDSDQELRRLFKSVNALLFPGGLTWLWLDSPYVIAARKLYNMAVEANEAGEPFPVCQQLLASCIMWQ